MYKKLTSLYQRRRITSRKPQIVNFRGLNPLKLPFLSLAYRRFSMTAVCRASQVIRTRGYKFSQDFCGHELTVDSSENNIKYFNMARLTESWFTYLKTKTAQLAPYAADVSHCDSYICFRFQSGYYLENQGLCVKITTPPRVG